MRFDSRPGPKIMMTAKCALFTDISTTLLKNVYRNEIFAMVRLYLSIATKKKTAEVEVIHKTV